MLSLVGLPITFFPKKYHRVLDKLSITNIECRQLGYYTVLLNQDALRQNIYNPNLIAPFKKLQEQKIKTLTLNDIIKPTHMLTCYKNNSVDVKVRAIFAGIQQRLNSNWRHLTAQWKKEFPDLVMHQPIANLRRHYQQTLGMVFDGYVVYQLFNPFEQDLCTSLITSQFMDEMIEANALWHITKPDAADTVVALVGSTHSGHLDIVKVAYTLADHLLALGYQHVTSFGLEDIHNVDAVYCQKVSKEIPQKVAFLLEQNNKFHR
jgi:hypothetical protein